MKRRGRDLKDMVLKLRGSKEIFLVCICGVFIGKVKGSGLFMLGFIYRNLGF